MADFYLSPEDVQLIDEAVFRLFGRNLSNAGRIALENITDNQNQALTLATEANTRLDVLEPRVAANESAIIDLQAVDAATEIRMDALEAADTALDARIDSLESERIGTAPFTEGVQDVIGASVAGSGGVQVTYDDPSGITTASLTDTGVAAGTYKSVTVDLKGRVTAGTNPTTLAGYGITDAQPLDADLTAIAALAGTGIAVRTTLDTWAQRSLTAPAAGITITNPAGIAGNPTFALANDLSALEALAGTGIAARTAADTWAQRTITAGNGIAVTNGNGVSGNPTIAADGTVQAISTKTGAYTATASDEVLLCNGTFTLTLPAAASNTRRRYSVRNTGAGTVTIDPNAAELINGAATLALTGGQFATIVCDGSAWFTIG